MKRFVEGLDRGQSTLFPASLDDYVTEDNLVRAVDAFVDSLELDSSGSWVSSHSTPADPVITPTLCSTFGASDGGRRSRLRQARAVCRDRCLSGCRWGRHAGPLPARRRRLAAGWVLYPGLTNPTPSIRSRLFRASTRASQRENFRRSASVALARPAAQPEGPQWRKQRRRWRECTRPNNG